MRRSIGDPPAPANGVDAGGPRGYAVSLFTFAAAGLLATVSVAAGSSVDGGFSPDAGERGQVIDSSAANDGGTHTEERIVPRVTVRIVGARVLPPEVYLDMLVLPPDARPTAETAASVQRQFVAYLERTGFQLATVGVAVEGEEVVVQLDEGQLDRVLYIGQLSFQQVRFKLSFSIPYDVFNRPLLDRQVQELSRDLGLKGVRWELVHSGEVVHAGPQLAALPVAFDLAMQGDPMVHVRRPYEVRIYFPSKGPGTGLGLMLRTTAVDGFESGLSNTWGDLLFTGDRLTMGATGGFGLRSRLDTERFYVAFSRGYTQVRYDAPQLLALLRPGLWVQNDWVARQRADLFLENYWAVSVAATAQVQLQVSKGLHFHVGAGFEWRRLFGFIVRPGEVAPDEVVRVERLDRRRPLLRLVAEWVVDPQILRWDRRHVLELEVRQYVPVGLDPGLGWLQASYRQVWPFGWHDFWVKSVGHLSWGEVTFHDEVSLGHFTRGVFATQFVRSAVNLSLEFRFSIARDLLKASLFHDLVLMAFPHRDLGTVEAQLADAFGFGMHLLMHDMFQVDAYTVFEFRPNAPLGAAFNLQFQKAF